MKVDPSKAPSTLGTLEAALSARAAYIIAKKESDALQTKYDGHVAKSAKYTGLIKASRDEVNATTLKVREARDTFQKHMAELAKAEKAEKAVLEEGEDVVVPKATVISTGLLYDSEGNITLPKRDKTNPLKRDIVNAISKMRASEKEAVFIHHTADTETQAAKSTKPKLAYKLGVTINAETLFKKARTAYGALDEYDAMMEDPKLKKQLEKAKKIEAEKAQAEKDRAMGKKKKKRKKFLGIF
ncbi:MAG: hypothetical protein HRT89_20445 [Lentisphaeria bacterium]|nr:hypothetical protein [Lentisphaeria bacterium]